MWTEWSEGDCPVYTVNMTVELHQPAAGSGQRGGRSRSRYDVGLANAQPSRG